MADDAKDPLGVANDLIRGAAKWVFGAAAGVAAALIAGSQLSSIGKLDVCTPTNLACSRLPVAVAGAVVALAALGYLIYKAVDVLLPVGIPFADIELHWDDPTPRADVKFFKDYPAQLGYPRPAGLIADRDSAWNDVETAEAALAAATTAAARATHAAEVKRATEEFDRLDGIMTTLCAVAQHEVLKAKFRALLTRVMVSSVGVAVGILAFAWAGNPPEKPPPSVDMSGLRLVGVDFSGADLSGADLSKADLSGANLSGATLTGARLVMVVWHDTVCPDGTNSDNHDRTCLGHLSP